MLMMMTMVVVVMRLVTFPDDRDVTLAAVQTGENSPCVWKIDLTKYNSTTANGKR
jgi:hypothetical protein